MRLWMCMRVVAGLGLVLLSACFPTEMPGYSPDGKLVALAGTDPAFNKSIVYLYNVETKQVQRLHMPGLWAVENVCWLGDRLWVTCEHRKSEEEFEFLATQYDPVKRSFVDGALKLEGESLEDVGAFVIAHEGKQVLLVMRPEEGGEHVYDIYSLPELKKTGRLTGPEVIPAGWGWSVRVHSKKKDHLTRDVVGIEVFDGSGRKAFEVPLSDMPAAAHSNPRFPRMARVSADGSVIGIAFGAEEIRRPTHRYSFGVWDTKTGKNLWTDVSDSMEGLPLLKRDEAWSIEFVGRQVRHVSPLRGHVQEDNDPPYETAMDRFSLVYYLAKPLRQRERRMVLTYSLPEGCEVRGFAPSPDGTHMLLAADGPSPRLLFIPLKEDVTEKDVRVVQLTGK